MRTVFELIEEHGLTLHGDIEHFAELVRADERNRTWTKEHWTEAQREWVDLTGEQIHEACWESYIDPVTGECSTGDRECAVRWALAKLKEKNT